MLIAGTALLAVSIAPRSVAVVPAFTWIGTTDDPTLASNWTDNQPPSGTGLKDILFNSGSGGLLTLPSAGLIANSLSFDATHATAFTLAGIDSPILTLSGDVTTLGTGAITVQSSLNLILNSDGTDNSHTIHIGPTATTVTVEANVGEINGAQGPALVTKTGAGTLVLSGNNSYTGATTINGGVLRLGSSTALPALTSLALGSGATLDLAGNNASVSSLTGDSSTVVTLGSGKLTVDIADGNNIPFSGSVQGTDTGSLVKTGPGTLTLMGQNYYGNTDVQAGTLVVGAENTLRAGAPPPGENSFGHDVSVSNGATLDIEANQTIRSLTGLGTVAISSNATFTLNLPASGAGSTVTFGGELAESGGFVKDGPGSLTLSGDSSTYDGTITVESGTLSVAHASALGSSGAATLVQSGGALELSGVDIGNERLDLAGIGPTAAGALVATGTSRVSGQITFMESTKIGVTGTLELANTIYEATEDGLFQSLTKVGTGDLILSAFNEFFGPTQIAGGTLTLNHSDALHHSTLDYANHGGAVSFGTLSSATLGGLQGGQSLALENDSSAAVTLTVGNNNENTTYSGVLSGNGSLVKSGNGNLQLEGNNTYAGLTTINSGTLTVAHVNALGSTVSETRVNTGATLTLDGVATPEPVKLLDGTLSSIGSSSLSGAVTLSGSGNVSIFPLSDALTISGAIGETGSAATLTKDGQGTLTLSGANTYTGPTNVNGGTLVADHASALGTSDGATSVASGATLEIDGVAIGNEPITLAGNLGGTGTASLGGDVTLAGFTNVKVGSGSQLTISGAIGESGGARGLTKVGTGELVLTGANTYSGFTTVSEGSLRAGATNTLPSTTSLSLGAGAKLYVDFNQAVKAFAGATDALSEIIIASGKSLTLSPSITGGSGGDFHGVISGNGSLVINGANSTSETPPTYVGLKGDNDYTGGTTLTAGILSIGDGGTSGWVTGNIANNGTLLFSRSDVRNYSGVISGTGNVSFSGGGTFTIGASQLYSGSTYISGSTLNIGVINALPAASSLGLGTAGTILNVNNHQTVASLYGDSAATINIAANKTLTIAPPSVTGESRLGSAFAGTLSGPGTLAINAPDDQDVVLSGNSIGFTGTTVVSQGALIAANDNALGTGEVTISGGTLATTSGVSIPNSLQLNSGLIAGSGSFGTAVIGSNMTVAPVYAFLSDGHVTAAFEAASSLGFSNLTLAGGGTYEVTFEQGIGATSFSGSPDNVYTDVINVDNTLTLANSLSSTAFTFKFVSSGSLSLTQPSSWTLISAGSLAIESGAFQSTMFEIDMSSFSGSNAGTFSLGLSGNNVMLNFTPVPEPSTWALMIAGGGVLAILGIRRRRQASR